MITQLREDKEGDDYDEDARLQERSVNYQNSFFNGQGFDDEDEKQERICGPMENVTFHIRDVNKMNLLMGEDTQLFKDSRPANEDSLPDTTGRM